MDEDLIKLIREIRKIIGCGLKVLIDSGATQGGFSIKVKLRNFDRMPGEFLFNSSSSIFLRDGERPSPGCVAVVLMHALENAIVNADDDCVMNSRIRKSTEIAEKFVRGEYL